MKVKEKMMYNRERMERKWMRLFKIAGTITVALIALPAVIGIVF